MKKITKEKLDLIFLMDAEKKSLVVQSSVGIINNRDQKLKDFFYSLPDYLIKNAELQKNLIGFEKAESLFGFKKYIDILSSMEESEILGKSETEILDKCKIIFAQEKNSQTFTLTNKTTGEKKHVVVEAGCYGVSISPNGYSETIEEFAKLYKPEDGSLDNLVKDALNFKKDFPKEKL